MVWLPRTIDTVSASVIEGEMARTSMVGEVPMTKSAGRGRSLE